MKIKNTTVESTPFASVTVTDRARKGDPIAWFKLYRSANPGTYGHQVCYEGALYPNTPCGDFQKFEGKTGGYGYCKEAQALNDCIRAIIGTAPSCHYEAHSLLHRYHKGGNYYELSVAQLRKTVREHK